MNEKILKIEEFSDEDRADGFKIVTDKQTIKFGIDNQQDCCEQWGYLASEDDFSDFIGSYILDIKLVDENLMVDSIKEGLKEEGLELNAKYDETAVMFVNIETTKGTLQFVAYNSHNGYYSHYAFFLSNQIEEDCYL